MLNKIKVDVVLTDREVVRVRLVAHGMNAYARNENEPNCRVKKVNKANIDFVVSHFGVLGLRDAMRTYSMYFFEV